MSTATAPLWPALRDVRACELDVVGLGEISFDHICLLDDLIGEDLTSGWRKVFGEPFVAALGVMR